MSEKGSVFQKGGGGTNFEQSVQTAFLLNLIIKGNAPLGFANEIVEVAFQTTNRGYQTDDLLVIAKSAAGSHRILLQIKHNISFTEDNAQFKEVLAALWKDYNNSLRFDKGNDRLIVVKSGLTKEERNHLKSVLDWSRSHATLGDYLTEINRIKGKKQRLDFFRQSLQEANLGNKIDDNELWGFLRCFDILEYDFSSASSVDEAYFLNLIKLSKSPLTSSSDQDIWASALTLVTKLNSNGGSATTESIRKEQLYSHFNHQRLNLTFRSIEKLSSDGQVILTPIKNTVSGFHLRRANIGQAILESVAANQFTIVSGKPGVGKSAEVKSLLKRDFTTASIFTFRADQFAEPHLANVFSGLGVTETLVDIFSCISLIPEKLIFIDSLERLLESDPECAFKQLIGQIRHHPDIRILATSRKYAIDLLLLKFGITKEELGIIDVPLLNAEELAVLSNNFPQLIPLFKNQKIRKVLQSPKYLDFAVQVLQKEPTDLSRLSLIDFKGRLWSSLVKNATKRTRGLAAKREDAFLEIAINRAKEMKLFTRVRNGDEEAIELLEADEIIFQDGDKRRYAPMHDILEDWALVKYIDGKQDQYPDPKDLYNNLGNQPAIRRAFRLWVEDLLIDGIDQVEQLIRKTINCPGLDGYWADEILVAVFKADDPKKIFTSFETELLNSEKEFNFLIRCIYLLRTACKESNPDSNNPSLLLPVGGGWQAMLIFLQAHIRALDSLTNVICRFLSEWNLTLIVLPEQVAEEEKQAAKQIILYYLDQIESGNNVWDDPRNDNLQTKLVSILFQLAPIARNEIAAFIKRAVTHERGKGGWRLGRLYRDALAKCTSGSGNEILVKSMPSLVVETARAMWLNEIIEEEYMSTSRRLRAGRLKDDECWGMGSNRQFSPPGIYKTPLYSLLLFHLNIALKFLTEIINASVDFYVKASCDHKLDLIGIEIELNDATKVRQWAAWELWVAFRGISVTHYGLESLLMSLEKYLLNTASNKTETSRKELAHIYNYLLANSNNVAIAGVLASVAMAYPLEVGESMLPLLSVKEFYQWDLQRVIREGSSMAMIDRDHPHAQQERLESNRLPHRKQYSSGLASFILGYQFNIGAFNEQIHKVFDRLRSAADPNDLLWQKRLTEIDARSWEIASHNAEKGELVIQPKYEEDVRDLVESKSEYFTTQAESVNYAGLLADAYEKKKPMDFDTWSQCYIRYEPGQNTDGFYDRPITLSALGLRDFELELSQQQKQWCLERISDSITAILEDTFGRFHSRSRNYNPMEKEIALSSLHYLFRQANDPDQIASLIALTTLLLSGPFHETDLGAIFGYVRSTLNAEFPKECERVWCSLIELAAYQKSNGDVSVFYDSEKAESSRTKQREFLDNLAKKEQFSIEVSLINFENSDATLLLRAFLITPFEAPNERFTNYVIHCIKLIENDLRKDEDHSYSMRKLDRQLSYEETDDAQEYIRNILLYGNTDLCTHVAGMIVSSLSTCLDNDRAGHKDLIEFLIRIPELIIFEVDKVLANSDDENLTREIVSRFWTIWKHLFESIQRTGKILFAKQLLLEIDWKDHSRHWRALEAGKDFYLKMVETFGASSVQSVIKVFSTCGEQTFLPEGIHYLTTIFKAHPSTKIALISSAADRLIARLFHNHIAKIKSEKKLVGEYLWILDRMVEYGSSEAYFFRENVITYKAEG